MAHVLAAFIDEENCIGCGKCIRVCPTDAIVGAKHVLHTIMPKFCTSCEECINACPTDCISLKTPCPPITKEYEQQLKQKKQARLLAAKSFSFNQMSQPVINTVKEEAPDLRKQQIADAIARVKARKSIINQTK